jgi:four helix bundle protein
MVKFGFVSDFRKLDVFDKAHRLTLDVYAATQRYPRDETFGLTSQTRRAAASIGANLAEGAGRNSDRELARFARIALGVVNFEADGLAGR